MTFYSVLTNYTSATNECGMTALMYAAVGGRVETLSTLLDATDQSYWNQADDDGLTAFDYARTLGAITELRIF